MEADVRVGKSDAFGSAVDDGAEVEVEGEEVLEGASEEEDEDGLGKNSVCLRTSFVMLLVGDTAGALVLVDADTRSPPPPPSFDSVAAGTAADVDDTASAVLLVAGALG